MKPPPPIIVKTPGTCGGQPRIRGTRVTVEAIWSRFFAGESVFDLWCAMPNLSQRQIEAALRYHVTRGRRE